MDYWKLKSAAVEFEKYWNRENQAELEKHWAMVEKLAEGVPYSSLLDVGCGIGNLVAFTSLASKESYLGIDVNPSMVERARILHPGYRFEVSELKSELKPELPELPGSDQWEQWDLVVANGFLLHQHDFFLKLDRLAKLTKACLIFDFMVAREGESKRSPKGYWSRSLGRDEHQFMKRDLEKEFSLEEAKYGSWGKNTEYYLRCGKKRM